MPNKVVDYPELLRQAAMELHDKADELIGDLDRVTKAEITIEIDAQEIPRVTITRTFFPKVAFQLPWKEVDE